LNESQEMNIRKLGWGLIGFSMSMALATSLRAEETTVAAANMLIYIHPQEYTSHIKLWQYYKDYWFQQGPLVEASALKVLGKEFGDVGMCDNNQTTSKTLVWLRPKMFYNPQVLVFYGKITAVAYNAAGSPIATYVGEASKQGFLDVKTEQQVTEVYEKTMQNLAEKMKADSNLQAALKAGAATAGTPCSMVSLLPAPKVQIMSY